MTGVFNGILVTGDMLGDAMFYGQGAGKLATASAVAADVIDCAVHKNKRRSIGWGDGSKNLVRSLDTFASNWYIRVQGADAADKLAQAFPNSKVLEPVQAEEAAVLTDVLTTAEMNEKKAQLGNVLGCMRLL